MLKEFVHPLQNCCVTISVLGMLTQSVHPLWNCSVTVSCKAINLSKKNAYAVTPSQQDVSTKSAFIFYRLENKKEDLTENHHPMSLLCKCKVT